MHARTDLPDAGGSAFRLSMREDGIAAITIDTPGERMNVLKTGLIDEANALFDRLETQSGLKGVIFLSGKPGSFIAGADVRMLAACSTADEAERLARAGQDFFGRIEGFPVPVVAAIDGLCLGGGLELALACDLRVAASDAKLGLPEVTRGLIPGYGGTQRLQRLIGLARATDIVLTGRMVGADEALALGLVNRVEDDALVGALAVAEQCARNAPVALGLAKEALMRGVDVTLPQGLEIEADLFGLVLTTDDAKEGIASFFEKRDPEYRGS